MKTIRLNRLWHLGDELERGGFARVVAGTGEDGLAVAIKLIPKEPGADRELLFASLPPSPCVLPVLDRGEVDAFLVLVMPMAEMSLRRLMTQVGGPVPSEQVMPILADLSEGLCALDRKVVHRDIKPENILRYAGRWCIADFGIARYAAASTSLNTRKHAMTPPYAAPEQWRMESPTGAVDVYAFGVVAYELLAGLRPFRGPREEDFREQHLHATPQDIEGRPASLLSLVTECLYKAPGSRPTPENLLARLSRMAPEPSPARQRLSAANRQEADRVAKSDAAASVAKSVEEVRRELAKAARASLTPIASELLEAIRSSAPASAIRRSSDIGWSAQLGSAKLEIEGIRPHPQGVLDSPGYAAPFDVVATAHIAVTRPRDRYDYDGRAHSLWYCNAKDENIYRWYETAFMFGVFTGLHSYVTPFSLEPDAEVGRGMTPIMGTKFQLAWPFAPFDQGEGGDFSERWIEWFAKAYEGRLSHPSQMPERDPTGSYRRPARR